LKRAVDVIHGSSLNKKVLIMKKYTVIVSDLGNVLLPFDYGNLIRKLNKVEAGLGDKFAKLYKDNYDVHRNFESGLLSKKDFLKIMMGWTNNKLTREQFCKLYSKIFKLNKNVVALLPKFKKNFKLVLLSNTNIIHYQYGWKDYSFIRYFDKLVVSYKVGANKPEENIYRAVEKFTKQPSSSHLFIDDIKEYINGAKKLGWDGIQFKNYKQLVRDLKKKGIKI
jgi:glucose-1-phosphatase